MNKVMVRAPVRADLAGGTLDLWPLYLFHPGARTVNVAISYYAESEVAETGDSGIEIHLTDQQYEQRYESLHEIAADPKAALVHRVLEHFHLNGIRITTRTDAPRGSGLGGSSALTITLVRALSELAGNPIDGEDLIALVRDLLQMLPQAFGGGNFSQDVRSVRRGHAHRQPLPVLSHRKRRFCQLHLLLVVDRQL